MKVVNKEITEKKEVYCSGERVQSVWEINEGKGFVVGTSQGIKIINRESKEVVKVKLDGGDNIL